MLAKMLFHKIVGLNLDVTYTPKLSIRKFKNERRIVDNENNTLGHIEWIDTESGIISLKYITVCLLKSLIYKCYIAGSDKYITEIIAEQLAKYGLKLDV